MPVLQAFQHVAALFGGEFGQAPIIQYQHVDFAQTSE